MSRGLLPDEEWRSVVGFEGIYEVSDMGRVRSLDRIDFGGGHRIGFVLSPGKTHKGYMRVGLTKGRDRRNHSVHTLVLTAFKGSKPLGTEAAHDNGIRDDNKAENLFWRTPFANNQDRRRHGTLPLGETHHAATISEATARLIKARLATEPLSRDVAAEFHIPKSIVDAIRCGRSWRHI